MKSITDCVSANVYVEAQKIGSVIESPGFCRASPPWTLSVENLGGRDSAGLSGSASSSSGLLICVVLIFHRLQDTPYPLAILPDQDTSATKNRSAKLWASAACHSKLCGRTCDWGGSETSTKLRDVGSLAVSA